MLVGFEYNDQNFFYAYEIHRTPDTKRITEQLIRHAKVIQEGSLIKQYNASRAHHLLSIHDTKQSFDRTRKKTLKTIHGFTKTKYLDLFYSIN